jgi:hypothetical protein
MIVVRFTPTQLVILPFGGMQSWIGGSDGAIYAHHRCKRPRVCTGPLRDSIGASLVVTLSLDEGYLSAYTPENFRQIREQIAQLSGTDPAVRRLKRLIIGEAMPCDLDGQGRISVSDELWAQIGVKRAMRFASSICLTSSRSVPRLSTINRKKSRGRSPRWTSPVSMSAVFEFSHLPVLFRQTLEQLAIVPDGCYIDCTLGGGGHSSAILERLGPNGHLYGFDKDTDALAAAGERLAQVRSEGTYHLVHTDFGSIAQAVEDHAIPPANGILADLGVSSWQLDQAERGFSYMQEGPLDMRMNQTSGPTAADLVNTASEQELVRIIQDYGEERYAAGSASRSSAAARIIRSRPRPSWQPSSAGPCRPRRCAKPSIRPNGPSRRSGSRSMANCQPWKTCCERYQMSWPRVAGRQSSPSIRWKTDWSRRPSGPGSRPAPAHVNFPSASAANSLSAVSSPGNRWSQMKER